MPIDSPEIYWSFDVEADGPQPGDYSLVSVGLVPCYFDDGTNNYPLDVEKKDNQIYMEFKPISDKWVEEALAVSGLSRDHLWEHGARPEVGIPTLEKRIKTITQRIHGRGKAIAVAYPLSFDWMWLYWYFCKFGSITRNPFGFSGCLDIKTMYAAKADALVVNSTKRNMPQHLKSKLPHTHNALDDAMEQGVLFSNLRDWEGRKRR